jgi:hypothetical protein
MAAIRLIPPWKKRRSLFCGERAGLVFIILHDILFPDRGFLYDKAALWYIKKK